MSKITIDWLEVITKLKSAGVSQEQADFFIREITSSQSELATKQDLKDLERRLIIKLRVLIVLIIGITAVLVKLL